MFRLSGALIGLLDEMFGLLDEMFGLLDAMFGLLDAMFGIHARGAFQFELCQDFCQPTIDVASHPEG